jgi:hypothetical protein
MKPELKDYYDKYGRLWHGPYPFTSDAVEGHAPAAQGLYQVLYQQDAGFLVAYIGIATLANTIRRRLKAHVSGRSNWALGRLTEPAKFSFAFFECDAESAKQIESHIVTTEKPPFNVKPEYKHYVPSVAVH